MPQIINTNIASLNAQNNLNRSQNLGDTALERLSSGLRINSAADDAAGLAIATRFQSQISGTQVAIRNSGDAISLAQTAEGALDSITTSLQRVRELALQSANDTNTDVDRAALQEEVEQLKAEIANVAEKTNFNGKKLLDGSFQNSQFQTGANVGDTITVSVSQLDTSTLGSAQAAGISSTVDGTVQAGSSGAAGLAMEAGDLVINGIAVGASTANSDDSSTALASSSAIAKAAAINEVSDQTGVTAVANANTAEGTEITAASAETATVTLNGVSVDLSTTSTASVKQNLDAVASQINDKADATGVSASVVATDNGYRVDLTAEDGRNITIADDGTTNANAFGLFDTGADGEDSVVLGNYTLVSTDGSDIELSTDTDSIDNSGFEAGTYSGLNGGAVGDADSTTGSNQAGARDALSSGDLLINGVDVGATLSSDDTASISSEDASAISLAAAINRVADDTGVSAEVNANTVYGTDGDLAGLSSGTSYGFSLNGVDVTFTSSGDTASDQQAFLDAVNAETGKTGVRAEALGDDNFQLIAEDGRNIVTDDDSGASATDVGTFGAGTDTYVGSVTLESAGEFTLSSNTGNIEQSGLRVGTFGGAETGTKLADLDVSTVQGANAAIQAVDNALQTITSQRAELGAVQNRFQNTISNLESLNENLSAAQSRIQDADFAAETARLAKAQVLQQAGISVLAQANARPQQALSLLQ